MKGSISMQVRYELPADEQISLRVAVRYALYGVVLTKLFDEPVDREEYRINAQPRYLLHGLDDADGYRMRSLFVAKLLEEVEQGKLLLHGYRVKFPRDQPSFDRVLFDSSRGEYVVNEEKSEIFEINGPFVRSVSRDSHYFEYCVPDDAKYIHHLWTRVSVEKIIYIRFLDRIGMYYDIENPGAHAASAHGSSADLVIKDYRSSGRIVERHFSEVRVSHEDAISTAKGEGAEAIRLPSSSAPTAGSRLRKSVRRARNAIPEKLREVYPGGVPPALPVKSIREDLKNIGGLVVSESSVRRALEDMGLRTPTLQPTLRSRRSSQSPATPDKSDKPNTP
jgi:hypothetical protein